MSREGDLQALVIRAAEAYRAGQSFYVARLKLGAWSQPGKGELDSWSDSLAAVESQGWVLVNWSTGFDPGGGLNAFPVFRRRDVPMTPVQDWVR